MTLKPNETRHARIRAREVWNPTGIVLVGGQRYEMRATGTWTDFFITRDANGFTSAEAPRLTRGLLQRNEHRRRRERENWFTLIGTIGRDENTAFRIGTEAILPAPASGELMCYANDVLEAYWNNWGAVDLAVTRVP